MNRHFLKMNPDKTEIIVFVPESMKNLLHINETFLENDCIRFPDKDKHLGYTLDKFLTEEH